MRVVFKTVVADNNEASVDGFVAFISTQNSAVIQSNGINERTFVDPVSLLIPHVGSRMFSTV
jgi:hypothetical protein